MSVKAMAWVWDQDMGRDEKLVALAYADHADHNGDNIFPSVDTVSKKTGYSERSVQRITKTLIANGWLIPSGVSDLQTNKYSMPIGGGDKMTPPIHGGAGRGDKMTGGDKFDKGGVTKLQGGGDIAMTPEPSINHHIKPSSRGDPIFSLAMQLCGSLSPANAQKLTSYLEDYPRLWIEEALNEAISRGAKHINYIDPILKQRENGKPTNGKQPADNRHKYTRVDND